MDVASGAHCEVSVGDRDRPVHVDIATRAQQAASIGKGDARTHFWRKNRCQVDITPATHHQVSARGGNFPVDVDIPSRVQRQRRLGLRRGPRPGEGHGVRREGDIAPPACRYAGCPGVCRGDGDVGAAIQKCQEGAVIYIGRTLAGVRREHTAGQRVVRGRRPGDRHVGWVEKPGAGIAVLRAGVDPEARHVEEMTGGLDQAAVAALRTAARGNGAVRARRVVRPHHDRAAAAIGDRVSIDRGARAHIGSGGILYARVLALVAAADQHSAAAGVTGGIDVPVEESDMVTGYRHAPARLPGTRAGGVERAAYAHGSALHVAQEADRAATRIDGLRLDHTCVVHRRLEQAARRLRCEHHLPAVGTDQAGVPRQCIERAFVHGDVEQAIAGHIQRHRIARRENDRAQARGDHAFVAHAGAKQRDIPAVGVDRALIDYSPATRTFELVAARHEIRIGDVARGCDKAAHVDLRAGAEQDAVRVDEEHFAIGREAAENARGIRAQHAIQRDRAAVGLHEAHGLRRSDAEALPVDRRVLARLGDRRLAWRRGDAGAARRHGPADGQGDDAGAEREHERAGKRANDEARSRSGGGFSGAAS